MKTVLIETQDSKETRIVLDHILTFSKRMMVNLIGGGIGKYTGSLTTTGADFKIKQVDYQLISDTLDREGIPSIEVSHASSGKMVVVLDKIVAVKRGNPVDQVPGQDEQDQLILTNGSIIPLKNGESIMSALEGLLDPPREEEPVPVPAEKEDEDE